MNIMEKKNTICGLCMLNKIILLGNEGKRKDFFLKAANDLNKDIQFFPLFSKSIFDLESQESYAVKIDPPLYTSADYSTLNRSVDKYFEYLKLLEGTDFKFLNTPSSLRDTLDKKTMKKILLKNQLPMAKTIDLDFYNVKSLLKYLRLNNISNVFIKPTYGSGAVGVLALKCNFRRDEYVLFTSLLKVDKLYINTKKLRCIKDRKLIFDLLSRILEDKPLIERWIEKKRVNNIPFDLRVLVNFGEVDFIVGRGSKGPITNLHLNNNALEFEELDIDETTLDRIKDLAIRSVSAFEGLNCGGVDVLLSKNDEIFIIEVNGQGDLIYKDIFDKNLIYKKQIERIQI